MKAVLQRVSQAEVTIDGKSVGKIGNGLAVLLGVAGDDTEADALLLCDKIIKMRIFSDENGKLNLSLCDVGGELLVVSNFTLNANYKKGNRPDYFDGAAPERAESLYEYFKQLLRERLGKVESGVFGADMKLSLTNDGPVTIICDSAVLRK